MRFRLPIGRTLFFVAAFALSVLALMPLRLAVDWLDLDEHGFAAREARGTLWVGALREVQFGSVSIGDLQARLNVLPLFLGRARVALDSETEGSTLKGGVSASRGSFGLDDLSVRLGTAAAFAPLPISSIDLQDVSARFSDGACVDADGRVRAEVQGQMGGLTLPGGLTGTARCEGEALLLPLTGQSGLETLNLYIYSSGRYRADLIVQASDPVLQQQLVAAGFTAGTGGLALTVNGAF